jgi:ParB family chromosome partitioning protein
LELLQKANLTERHARALLKLPNEREKIAAIGEILRLNMSVAQTEKYIDKSEISCIMIMCKSIWLQMPK